jgi:hypothetical protein
MGTFLTDKCREIRSWLAIGEEVYPDIVIIGWIRMAEEYLSTALRVKHMVQIDTQLLTYGRVPLPLDWQEIRLVRFPSIDGGVCRYNTPDAFFNPEFPDGAGSGGDNPGMYKRYTILGNFIIIGGIEATGIDVELTYYQSIQPLTNDLNNWVNCYNSTVYTLKILHIASLYAIEDQRGPVWDQEVTRMVNGMNAQHKIDMASGSVLVQTRRKSFG